MVEYFVGFLLKKEENNEAISSKSNSEENKDDIMCSNCTSKEGIKVGLNCKHFICRNCIITDLMEKFCTSNYHRYRVFCKKCSLVVKISILSLTFKEAIYLGCEDKCKWTDIKKKIKYNFKPSSG